MVCRTDPFGIAYCYRRMQCESLCFSGKRRHRKHEPVWRCVFMPAAYWLGAKLTKRPYCKVCDVFTPCMLFTLMCARVNCIVAGCCSGLVIPGTHFHFPTRELEILYYIVMLILLIPRAKRARTPAVFTHFIWHPTERSAFLMNSSGRPLRGCCSISLMSGQPSHLRRDSAFT